MEYEQHLVLVHLLRCNNHRQPESVTLASTTSNSVDSSPDGSRRVWSIFQAVVNLPAVLNDPNNRQLDIFSRTWGDQFERTEVTPSMHLPVITDQHFSNYLARIGVSMPSSHKTAAYFLSPSRQGHPQRRQSQNGLPDGLKNSTSPHPLPSGHLVDPRPAKMVLQPEYRSASSQLDTIPATFFTPDFNLRHWRTFAEVIPLQQRGQQLVTSDTTSSQRAVPFAIGELDEETRLVGGGSHHHSLDRGGDAAARSLQGKAFHRQHDRLTQYLDVVEMHLAEQVSKKSSVFFEAVCCHDIVREQLNEALLQITVVRSKLACVDAALTNSIMQLHQVVRRRHNYRQLLARLNIISSLQAAQPTIQLLLRQNDFCAALDLVASTHDLLDSSPQLQLMVSQQRGLDTGGGDLGRRERRAAEPQQQLTCLRHLNAQMEEISRIVRQMIVAEFEQVLRRFIETPNSVTPPPPFASLSSQQNQLVADVMPDLVPCLLGLIHIQRLDFVSAFKAELLRQVKAIVSEPPQAPTAEAGVKKTSLSASAFMQEMEPLAKEQLRSLSIEVWIQVVTDKCTRLDGLLRCAEKAVDVFTTTLLGCANNEPSSIDTTTDGLQSRPAACLTSVTVASLIGQLVMTLSHVANAAQQHVLTLVSPRLQQGDGGGTGVETAEAGDSSRGEATTRPELLLDSRLSNKVITGAGAGATVDSAAATGSSRLTLDQLICLITVLQDFLENTCRTMHYEPPVGQQGSETRTAVDSSSAPANSSSGDAASSTSKLASLVAFTVRGLIHRFHGDSCEKMKLMLHDERWEAVAVPRQLQHLVKRTFEAELVLNGNQNAGAVSTAADQSDRAVWSCRRASTDDGSRGVGQPRGGPSSPGEETSRVMLLHGEPFIVVGTVLLLLPILVDYAELATRLPLQPWSVEELADCVAVFLSLFNSSTCELVLGAGATQSAVLPIITVRNLALASRSLQLVARCVPSLNVYFKRLIAGALPHKEETIQLPNGVADQVAGHAIKRASNRQGISYLANYLKVHHMRRKQNKLEHVDGLFSEHISGINNKLVQLLSDRISQQLVDWQVRPPTPSSHMRLICRAICRVAQKIGEIMPVRMLTPILLRAHGEFKVKLRERLSQLMIKADGGPQQSLVDSELAFYMQQLRPLSPKLAKFNDDFSDIWPVS